MLFKQSIYYILVIRKGISVNVRWPTLSFGKKTFGFVRKNDLMPIELVWNDQRIELKLIVYQIS